MILISDFVPDEETEFRAIVGLSLIGFVSFTCLMFILMIIIRVVRMAF